MRDPPRVERENRVRLTAPICAGLMIAAVLLRVVVMPMIGLEVHFQRGIEACSGLGLLLAAIAFDRGDPPRRPWSILAAGLLLVPAARAALALNLNVADVAVGHMLLILTNIFCVIALLGFRTILISTGLTPEWTSKARVRAAVIGCSIIAASIALVSYHISELGDASAMSTSALISASVPPISIIADAVMLAVGLLLVRAVQPMMGGSVALPYILVAVGGGVLLFVDVFSVVLKVTTQDQFNAPVPLALATLGWSAFALAGLSQRQLLRSPTR